MRSAIMGLGTLPPGDHSYHMDTWQTVMSVKCFEVLRAKESDLSNLHKAFRTEALG